MNVLWSICLNPVTADVLLFLAIEGFFVLFLLESFIIQPIEISGMPAEWMNLFNELMDEPFLKIKCLENMLYRTEAYLL